MGYTMKKLLIVVDYQVDFVTGSLGFNGAEKLEDKICCKIDKYRKNNQDILFTMDTHNDDYLNSMEGKSLPVLHCIENTEGHELYGKVKNVKKKEDKVIIKKTYGSLDLGNYLITKNYDSIELCGLVSYICVISNAIIVRTALPEAEIIVDALCTDGPDKKMNNKALDIMNGLNITVINREM